MPSFDLDFQESGVFLNEELGNDSADLGQIIVVDSGGPRGLLGDLQLERLKEFVLHPGKERRLGECVGV